MSHVIFSLFLFLFVCLFGVISAECQAMDAMICRMQCNSNGGKMNSTANRAEAYN